MAMTGVGMESMNIGSPSSSSSSPLAALGDTLKTAALVYGLKQSGLADWLDNRGIELPKEFKGVAPPTPTAPVPVAPVAAVPPANTVVAAPVAPVVAPVFKENIAPPIVGQEPNVLNRKEIDDHFPVSQSGQQETGNTLATVLKLFFA